MNEKGSMNNKELERYTNNSIVPLFPNLEDMPGKRIMLKVNTATIATGWTCSTSVGSGVFTFTLACPTLPLCSRRWTSTTVHIVQRNLAKIAMTFYTKGITISLGTSTFGLIVVESALIPE
jgi:hypothetical protein